MKEELSWIECVRIAYDMFLFLAENEISLKNMFFISFEEQEMKVNKTKGMLIIKTRTLLYIQIAREKVNRDIQPQIFW